MVTIQYFENNSLFFSQLVKHVPAVDHDIKIKGRKAKVIRLNEINENLVQVHVNLEKKNKKVLVTKEELKKKKK
ncbi:hypothetical protein [Bacillus benzoevorans]|uniref:Uncharacterized protein n=1 Tax=Bacillus benzoevorans TaxID=1456 RepID=A0A7X0HV14_9BACI|nr:hypothetical protein [Bacillus benzoevorans]MBB6447405.1 hypothetical protein [Bacillus benzoevorans]